MGNINENIIESLDSNWFFCNAFKPPSFSSSNFKESHEPKQHKPSTPIHLTQRTQSSSNIQIQKQLISEADKEILQAEPTEKEQGAGERSGKQGYEIRGDSAWTQEEIKGFMELGFNFEESVSDGYVLDSYVTRCGGSRDWFERSERRTRDGFGRSERLLLRCKIPPYGDGIAMKEHLRSWAYAVACTVR